MTSLCEKCSRKRSSCPALGNGNNGIKFRKVQTSDVRTKRRALVEDNMKRANACKAHFVGSVANANS